MCFPSFRQGMRLPAWSPFRVSSPSPASGPGGAFVEFLTADIRNKDPRAAYAQPVALAPAEESPHGMDLGPPRVQVSGCAGEELLPDESRGMAGSGDQGRHPVRRFACYATTCCRYDFPDYTKFYKFRCMDIVATQVLLAISSTPPDASMPVPVISPVFAAKSASLPAQSSASPLLFVAMAKIPPR